MPSLSTASITQAPQDKILLALPIRRGISENVLIALGFAFTLLVFFAVSVANCLSSKTVLNENRNAAKLPRLHGNWTSLCSFPQAFDEYFNDRFAFRDRLISTRSLIGLKLFRVPGSPKVVMGKNGFYFYADKANRSMIMGAGPFTTDELQSWKRLLERRYYWCKERGIDYYFVLAPTKSSIYPELLPDEYAKCKRLTRTDELIAFLNKTKSPVRIVDMRTSVRNGKGSLPLFLRTDTHWNQLGSYYGYKSMIESLKSKHPTIHAPTKLSEFNISPYHFKKGDLARLQGLFGILTETNLALNRKRQPNAHLFRDTSLTENEFGSEGTQAFAYNQSNTNLPRVVMFRDSFACYMVELFLPEHFSRISFYWQPEFSDSVVSREKPDIVVQETLESSLYCSPPEM